MPKLSKVYEFVLKVTIVVLAAAGYFALAGSLLNLSGGWLMQSIVIAGWALGTVPVVYVTWRLDLSKLL